jgi:hypothetical protein
MNTPTGFMESTNMSTLWDIIVENGGITIENVHSIKTQFIESAKQFNQFGYHPNLVEMNKKFLTVFLSSARSPVTSEEIQQTKKAQFERELNVKQQEFHEAVNKVVPPVPKFQDDMDTPISEMEKLIAETIAQRNFEMEQIHQKHWNLKQPQESSSIPNSSIKYITIGEEVKPEDVFKKQDKKNDREKDKEKKSLSWSPNLVEDEDEHTINEDPLQNIFSKLKPMPDNTQLLIDEIASLHKKIDTLIEMLSITKKIEE